MNEFVRRPLYDLVGGGDLGTTAVNLSRALQQIFDVATAWKAIVLINEVGTFLTELLDYVLLMISFFRLMFSLSRDRLHDLERNAMVAVLAYPRVVF